MKVGYIGLGNMGRAQVMRLISQGVPLTVWNRTAERAQGIPAEAAETPAQVMASCDVVFLCLFDSDAVRDVAAGPDGLFAAPRREAKVVVDCTTNSYDDAVAFHDLFAQEGLAYLESPVLGSVVPASQGALVALVSGEEPPLVKAEPYLRLIAREVLYMPPPGSATAAKLASNVVIGVTMAGMVEAVALGEAAGIPRDRVLDVLEFGPAAPLVAAKREMLLTRDFSPHYSASAAHKDLIHAGLLARTLEVPIEVADVARYLYAEAIDRGRGQEDYSVTFEVVGGTADPFAHEESEAEPT
ncbi:MAG: NAD(P)-dependent oxidoreductase [Coriobacteriia bacterium]|nr:NAD(P)-dependent oxidoreductase [Coriobacteriia bacterium]